MTQDQQQPSAQKLLSVKEFLEEVPPGQKVSVRNVATRRSGTYGGYSYPVNLEVLKLHCNTDSCNGILYFDPTGYINADPDDSIESIVTFLCRNCRKTSKTYALRVFLNKSDLNGEFFKFGEEPQFGQPTPSRLISLIRDERDYYFNGRQCENQGMGIGAFVYYRRVVVNQKNKILDEIIRVSEKIGAPKEMLDDLKAAKKESRFSTAVEAIKHGIPPALLVNGQNPMTLLHNALSEGLHEESDEKCMELATSIRVVLTDLVDRMGNALKDEAEIKNAVSRLMKAKTAKPNDTS